jgi:hypothetical protein
MIFRLSTENETKNEKYEKPGPPLDLIPKKRRK